MAVPASVYLWIAAALFAVGGLGAVLRRSPMAMLMSVEMMWNAANLALITFARVTGTFDGQIFAFVVITVAAAEAAIGLALIVLLFRARAHADADGITALRG